MTHDRRTFLRTTSLAGVAAVAAAASLPAATDASAQGALRASEPSELPKGMTFATLRRAEGFGLGLRTDRGILDVVAAEQDFRAGAPTTIEAVLEGHGDINGLRRLLDKARASASADTPEGVIAGYPKDKQVWLKAGDKIDTSIEKLGELTFTLT